MRGKVRTGRNDTHQNRITPAYAGKSGRSYNLVPSGQDHPRLCGEKYYADFDHTCKNGITPAYAGKRFPYRYLGFYSQDHPRLCGEK